MADGNGNELNDGNRNGCMNGSLYLFWFFSVKKLRKNKYGVRTLTLELPPPSIRVRTLLAGPHLYLSERRYFMDDPQVPTLIVRDYIPMSKTWMLVINCTL